MKKDTKVTEKTAKTYKYQELNDSELEVICGGMPPWCEDTSIGKLLDIVGVK
ncbi:MAG: hypothetical protein MJK14_01145 [Rivularia sp. ALOHA_DT_140]|nr:hypothetical protein [Rivularia sp. ALOHA_DT_140]